MLLFLAYGPRFVPMPPTPLSYDYIPLVREPQKIVVVLRELRSRNTIFPIVIYWEFQNRITR